MGVGGVVLFHKTSLTVVHCLPVRRGNENYSVIGSQLKEPAAPNRSLEHCGEKRMSSLTTRNPAVSPVECWMVRAKGTPRAGFPTLHLPMGFLNSGHQAPHSTETPLVGSPPLNKLTDLPGGCFTVWVQRTNLNHIEMAFISVCIAPKRTIRAQVIYAVDLCGEEAK